MKLKTLVYFLIQNYRKHIRYTTANARKLTGLIKRTVGHSAPVSVLQQLYSSIVMP